MIEFFLNPRPLRRFFQKMEKILLVVGMCLLFFTYLWIFFETPDDIIQGEAVKLMYIHVPAAWLSLACYGALGLFSLIFLIIKAPLAYYFSRGFARIGIHFNIVCLVTGSLWGIPTWGTWWVWDARLTSVLILLFLYAGYLLIGRAFTEGERLKKVMSCYAILGMINLPIIKWSVNWWNTLHQPASLTKLGTPSIETSMLIPLLLCFGGWCLMTLVYVLKDMQLSLSRGEK